jgi:hypothetical protein
VGWFTAHIREGIAVTGHQLELLQLGLAGNAGHRQLLERFLRWRLLRHL